MTLATDFLDPVGPQNQHRMAVVALGFVVSASSACNKANASDKSTSSTSQAADTQKDANRNPARVRYMVNDVGPAVDFYTKLLGFTVKQEAKPNFALLSRGNLELVLSTPYGPGGAAQPNRIILNMDDLAAGVSRIRLAQGHFRNDIVHGPGGAEILLDDPSGNPVELFQPSR